MNRRVVEIKDKLSGNILPIDKMEFIWIGEDMAYGHFKGYGFHKMYSAAGGYKVVTEAVI